MPNLHDSTRCNVPECDICKDELPFDVPEHLLQAAHDCRLVVFAGAGISTEQKRVFPFSFLTDVLDDLKLPRADLSFPEAMSRFCERPDAGLRCGEMMALEWSDVDLEKRQLRVERSDWKGQVTSTKGGRVRWVPMTVRLAKALRQHRHLRGRRVLVQDDGEPLTQKIVQVELRRAARRAQVREGVHILRHTFCSHLAMRGAAARAIQELAGHQDLSTTQRYMHLSPAAIESAFGLLDQPTPRFGRGDILETEGNEAAKVSG